MAWEGGKLLCSTSQETCLSNDRVSPSKERPGASRVLEQKVNLPLFEKPGFSEKAGLFIF